MGVVLVTGANGFIGSRLVPRLGQGHDVVALARRGFVDGCTTLLGSFGASDDLRALDDYEIDTVVHLAAEIEGSDDVCLSTNVQGTHTLLTYLIERGCSHFVIASSIAATGCQSEQFIPRELPIGDDHPCDAEDGYGLSKALMEDVAFWFQRRSPELEIALFRIGLVLPEDFRPDSDGWLSTTTHPFVVGGGMIAIPDVIDALIRAVDERQGAGVRRFNLVGRFSRTATPVPEALQQALGEHSLQLDMSYYRTAGREAASLYSIDRLWETYRFRPAIDVRTMAITT